MTGRNLFFALMIGCLTAPGSAQEAPAPSPSVDLLSDALVVPQIRTSVIPLPDTHVPIEPAAQTEPAAPFNALEGVRCAVPKISADVEINNGYAETTLKFQCVNVSQRPINAPIAVPLPALATLPKKMAPDQKGNKTPAESEVLSPAQALPVWQNLAKQMGDPAALEFCGFPLLKSAPVNLAAGESQPVTLEYVFTCPSSGPRSDYVLPKSESAQYAVPWSIEVNIQADQPISTVYSPSHKLKTKRISPHSLQVKVDDKSAAQPGGLWLSYLLESGELSATLFTQYDETTPEADGTFLFLAGVPATLGEEQAIPRELTLALDRSGSMQGPKIKQVRAAAIHVLEGLNDGESFNIITYSDQVNSFAEKPVRKTAETFRAACEFVDSVQPRGGTNLHEAILESVGQEHTPQTLPIVLFLTDGLPTVGETEEAKIREVITHKNPDNKRFFTVGVGVDVNTPLLEAIAAETRGQPTFILPAEDVKAKVSQVFQSLKRPILSDAVLEIANPTAAEAGRVSDVFPDPLPDLFQEDHLVILGRFQGTEPLTFRLKGNYLGEEKTFEFTFPVENQISYPFVSRLWATQKIAALVHEIRKSGATADPYDILTNPKQDPKLKQLAEETLKLTTRFGILTEYTAFLGKDSSRWLDQSEQLARTYRNFDERAVKTRVGLSSVNQSINNTILQRQFFLNRENSYLDANMQRVEVPNVQQMGNGAFFLRGTTWVDGRLVDRPNITPEETVTFGSPAYERILHRLVETGEHTPLSLKGDVLMEIDNKTVLIRTSQPEIAGPARPAVGREVPAKGE